MTYSTIGSDATFEKKSYQDRLLSYTRLLAELKERTATVHMGGGSEKIDYNGVMAGGGFAA